MRQMLLWFFLVMLPLGAMAEEVRPGVLRTPDARFENLKDFAFVPNYMEIDGLRIHIYRRRPEKWRTGTAAAWAADMGLSLPHHDSGAGQSRPPGDCAGYGRVWAFRQAG